MVHDVSDGVGHGDKYGLGIGKVEGTDTIVGENLESVRRTSGVH